ncbi:hypothetical protein KBI23_27290 [bacterium]|nr:hypothetical protein [bacterium]MBP9808392.1 hypothetical protein [bacterium]
MKYVNRTLTINLSLALTTLLLSVAPALAEQKLEDEVNINDYRILTTPDPTPDPAPASTKMDEKEKTKVSAKTSFRSQKAGHDFLAAPKAVGGVLMGMTIGVPVRIARDISHETLRMRDQMTDDVAGNERPDLFARTVGSYTGMAYGVVSGVIKGSIKGTERAIDCGARKPFSKESLSLQDPN